MLSKCRLLQRAARFSLTMLNKKIGWLHSSIKDTGELYTYFYQHSAK